MKIKTQFNLLIAGIILVPILCVSSQTLIWRLRQENAPRIVPLYEELTPYLKPALDTRQWKSFREFVSRLRSNTDIVLLHRAYPGQRGEDPYPQLLVIYSDIDNFAAGEKVTTEKIYSLILSGDSRYGYSFESPPWLQEEQIFLLSRNDREASRSLNPLAFAFRSLLTVLFMLFAFVLFMSIFIIRSVTRSVLVLEEATRRMAAGELDLNLEIEKTEFLRRDNEITSLTFSLNRMRLALKEEEQSRSRFIMGVSHDLKTPLALIKGYAEAIQDGITIGPEAQRNSLSIIADKVDQLDGMINDLINFVRLNTGEWQRMLKKVDLRAFLENYAGRLRDDAELLKQRLECRLDLPAELYIPMDEALVSRALENLVNNALRYTKENGLVRLSAFTRGDSVIIEVEDSGPGISPEDLPHVFEMFYRGDNSRRRQGLGLGLSVVKGVIDSHGWRISAESPIFAEDKNQGAPQQAPGTRFTIIVPYDP